MAGKSTKKKTKITKPPLLRRVRRWVLRGLLAMVVLAFALVAFFGVVDTPTTIYMQKERARLEGVKHTWVDFEDVSAHMPRSIVAAEDANFCTHFGFDMTAIRAAINSGSRRGASTLTQQVVKNQFLWQGRTWTRKALEATLTPIVELFWSKQRILEVYMNVAEFDTGVFGVQAAAKHYFGKTAADLSAREASLLAAILPNPKGRSPLQPTTQTAKRAVSIADGAATIKADGRASCFED